MTHMKALAPFLLILTFTLLACQFTGGINPSATSEVTTSAAHTFTNDENGVTARYPAGWITEEPQSSGGELINFLSPGQVVYASLYVFPIQSGDTAESVINQEAGSALQGVEEISIVSDAIFPRSDGVDAWSRVVTGNWQGSELKINLTALIYGTRVYFLFAYGDPSSYDRYSEGLNSIVSEMTFSAPIVNGVNRNQALFLEGWESTNPRDHDPATAHDAGDKRVFSGLVSFDTSLELVPEIVQTWDISPDGTIYTFHIREDAAFHDGRSVTAQDVIYSWERAADPATNSDTVLTYLGDIVGVAEMHDGSADQISGLQAIDEKTLQVTIDAAKPYFLFKLTMPVAFVLDETNVESGEEWYRTPNGTGPYKLTRWERFQLKVYDANPDYYLGVPSIPQIVVELYTGVGISLYESGEIDMTGVSTYDVGRVLDPTEPLHADMRSGVSLCTDYVVFDVNQPPFDDVKVRQAFNMAFNRQKYIEVVLNGVGVPAKGPYPPALPGYNIDIQGLAYDPAQARQLLTESKYQGPQGLPDIVFTSSGIGNTAGSDVSAMAQMWEQNLGVTITVENLEPNMFYDLLYSGQHGQLFSGGWCGDYPDPENFADVLFHTGSEQNTGNYSNTALDALLDSARTEQDVTIRIQLYQQAEEMIIQDAPAIFMTHGLTYTLVKPYVKGYVLTPISIPIERYLWLEP